MTNKPTHSVYLRKQEGQKERTLYIGAAWTHGKGSGLNLAINRPGDMVLEAIRNGFVELAIFDAKEEQPEQTESEQTEA